jgi:hypothetical protein
MGVTSPSPQRSWKEASANWLARTLLPADMERRALLRLNILRILIVANLLLGTY